MFVCSLSGNEIFCLQQKGFFPGEIDMTYYGLRVLEKLGLIWDLKQPTARALAAGQTAAGQTGSR